MSGADDMLDRRGAIRPPRTPQAPVGRRDWIGGAATAASLAWLGLAGWYLATLTPNGLAVLAIDPLAAAVALLGIVVPVALIWIAAGLLRLSRSLEVETTHLREELDAMREAHAVQARMGAAALRREMGERLGTVEAAALRAAREHGGTEPPAEERTDPEGAPPPDAPGPAPEASAAAGTPLAPAPASARAAPSDRPRRTPILSAPSRPARSPLEMLRAARADPSASPAPSGDAADGAGPEGAPAGAPTADTVLRAFDLPRGRDDADGFAAVRRVLADPTAGPPLAAAQTALALLSEGNLAATALPPAPPAAWRAWLTGEAAPAALGEITDPAAQALLVGRARAEPAFAAAAAALVEAVRAAGPDLAARMDDDALAALDRTRTGRAARLMARAAGALDAT